MNICYISHSHEMLILYIRSPPTFLCSAVLFLSTELLYSAKFKFKHLCNVPNPWSGQKQTLSLPSSGQGTKGTWEMIGKVRFAARIPATESPDSDVKEAQCPFLKHHLKWRPRNDSKGSRDIHSCEKETSKSKDHVRLLFINRK